MLKKLALALGLILYSGQSVANAGDFDKKRDGLEEIVEVRNIVAYELDKLGDWTTRDLSWFIQNPFPAGAGVEMKFSRNSYFVSYANYNTKYAEWLVPPLNLGDDYSGGGLKEGRLDFSGRDYFKWWGDFSADGDWVMKGDGEALGFGYKKEVSRDGEASINIFAQANIFSYNAFASGDGVLNGNINYEGSLGGYSYSGSVDGSFNYDADVDVKTKGVSFNVGGEVVLSKENYRPAFVLGVDLTHRTMGTEYVFSFLGVTQDLPDEIKFGKVFRDFYLGSHFEVEYNPVSVGLDVNNEYGDRLSVGLKKRF